MRQQMSIQDVYPAEFLVANFALERSDVEMRKQMLAQVVGLLESLVADVALTRFFTSVHPGVSFDLAEFVEFFAANIASEPGMIFIKLIQIENILLRY